MRTLITMALVFAAPLAALSEETMVSFDDLISKMSEGGKRTFLYQESIAARFAERRIHGGGAALEGPKAYEAGLEILKTGGFAAVPQPSGAMRIVLVETASKEALPVISSAEELPVAEEFCSLLVILRNARARDVLAPVQAMISDPRNVLASESTNSIIVSDYSSNLRKLAGIIRRIDSGQEASTWRISIAVLQGIDAGAASVPAGFESVKLEAATGRKAFTVLGDGMTTLLIGGSLSEKGMQGAATVRLWGGEKLSVDLRASLSATGALTLEHLKITGETEAGGEPPTMLQTRLGLKDGAWTIAGSLIGDGDNAKIRVVLVKAEPAK